jgi:hypothetical protein
MANKASQSFVRAYPYMLTHLPLLLLHGGSPGRLDWRGWVGKRDILKSSRYNKSHFSVTGVGQHALSRLSSTGTLTLPSHTKAHAPSLYAART